ncbi:hypothetical protein [Agrobacterium sp. CNPSo 2736]|uniref:hypothetical protein n=1 Tax=Agrobacterium sp. CNPSo 2736 TaxID=2499627 RepID=UPI001FE16C90|nr:hypothetical protein [Agrobacterium sp. CNPSo 2736]
MKSEPVRKNIDQSAHEADADESDSTAGKHTLDLTHIIIGGLKTHFYYPLKSRRQDQPRRLAIMFEEVVISWPSLHDTDRPEGHVGTPSGEG